MNLLLASQQAKDCKRLHHPYHPEFCFGSSGCKLVWHEHKGNESLVQAVRVDASASVSRIGGRAYPQALRELAQTARLELTQAGDAARFASSRPDAATAAALQFAAKLTAALAQRPGHPVPLEEQACVSALPVQNFLPFMLVANRQSCLM